ncbi:RidA family protein [Conexibacter woesei]|uniref:Endoribonuclease L-PSP n=1 Tax=Conexibacter woesei (strain DSM 14684 / CCUG 47730 / CIP 108061 / JCM 11494 / NBRC 100937 / ID131577) TaxID=469383 RepID=D3FCB9_CONWI|nr:RidA family protein [Conexibacter woesei]ADB53414.1 Endoribonuclease L-PSP [Conexibacter woesei DSM 14684]
MKTIELPGLSAAPLNAATVVDGTIYTSGQVGRDRVSGETPADLEGQVRATIANLEYVLEAAGGSLATVVKTVVFLTDASDFAEMNRVYAELMPQPYAPRSTVVVGLAHDYLKFEIEVIARVAS